jgi:chaperonin GroES
MIGGFDAAPGNGGSPPLEFDPPADRPQEDSALSDVENKSTLRPLADRCVIKAMPREEMTKSGLVLPDLTKEKPQEGTIVAAGPGRINDAGVREPMDVKVGDKVVFQKYAGMEFKVDGNEFIVVAQKDILAVIEE